MAIRKIDLMYRQFGKCEGHTCRECSNLIHVRVNDRCEGHTCRECSNLIHVRVNDRPLTKCKVYGDTPSEASDWVQRYQACGMFNKPWVKGPIIQLVRPVRIKQEDVQRIPLDGQIMLEV